MTATDPLVSTDLWHPTPEDELRLLVRNRSFTEVLSASPLGMALIDPDGRIRAANRELATLVEPMVDDPVGAHFRDLVHTLDRPMVDEAMARLLSAAGRSLSGDVHLAAAGSRLTPVRCTASPLVGVSSATFGVLVQVQAPAGGPVAGQATSASRDALTGIGTRAWLVSVLESRSPTGVLVDPGLTLFLFNIDGMRNLNDLLGHRGGDEVLVEMARRLVTTARRTDRVARVGADTFAVVSIGDDTVATATDMLRRLHSTLTAPMVVNGRQLPVQVYAGAATAPAGTRAHELFDAAETALAAACRQGPGGLIVLDRDATEANRTRLEVSEALRASLETRDFVLHYQPILSLHPPATITSHEALVRWRHHGRTRMPGEFIPVAEDTGLIRDIGVQIIERAIADLARRPDLATVALNVSAVQFSDGRWYDAILAATREHRIPIKRLVLEVTETAALALTAETRERLLDLRQHGAGLHLDDFGTGYSSVSLLRDLPLTGLKFDARFVREVAQGDPAADALSQGLAGLARGLGLHGVAEGVETVEQLEALRGHGWSHVQGYLIGRPRPLTSEGA